MLFVIVCRLGKEKTQTKAFFLMALNCFLFYQFLNILFSNLFFIINICSNWHLTENQLGNEPGIGNMSM
jgi:hypothetical protein